MESISSFFQYNYGYTSIWLDNIETRTGNSGLWYEKLYYLADANIPSDTWHPNRKLHRTDGPATIRYKTDGTKESEYYYTNGNLHRTDGPAIVWYVDGIVSCVKYCVNGQLHKTDGPAVLGFDEYGRVSKEEYRVNGELHRIDGPAMMFWDKYGVHFEFWIRGTELNKEEWEAHPMVISALIDSKLGS